MLRWAKQFVKRAGDRYNAASFKRDNLLDGELLSVEDHIRLFRKDAGEWRGAIHESVSYTGRMYRAPDSARILHDKSSAMQRRCNERYLQFYPKLNLGSGGRPMPADEGWTNYDLDTEAPDAVYADVFEELPGGLPASYILASHILEHVSYHNTAKVLSMWIDKLAPGGTIEVRVPDLDIMIAGFVSGDISYLRFLQLMFGGHRTKYDYHHIAINEGWLRGQLSYWGCVDIKRLPPAGAKTELRMTARKPL